MRARPAVVRALDELRTVRLAGARPQQFRRGGWRRLDRHIPECDQQRPTTLLSQGHAGGVRALHKDANRPGAKFVARRRARRHHVPARTSEHEHEDVQEAARRTASGLAQDDAGRAGRGETGQDLAAVQDRWECLEDPVVYLPGRHCFRHIYMGIGR